MFTLSIVQDVGDFKKQTINKTEMSLADRSLESDEAHKEILIWVRNDNKFWLKRESKELRICLVSLKPIDGP